MKNIITITGIRPDFIRMSETFRKLDKNFNHTLIHTGQHFDDLLSGVFFNELDIREPDYNLCVGGEGREHFHQTSELAVKLIELLRDEKLHPDMILFLGDSNSVSSAVPLKKEGYVIGHIEAGMRSGDKRMLEEINRIVCDHCSDYHFVYHKDYGMNLVKENLPKENIFVIGNTIVEPCKKIYKKITPGNELTAGCAWHNCELVPEHILLDIHRPENFKYKDRLKNILLYANDCGIKYNVPIKLLGFKRTLSHIEKYSLELGIIEVVDLMSLNNFILNQAKSVFLISDSGTAQEEPALFGIPVVVPRDYTERPQSMKHNCSFMLDVNSSFNSSWKGSYDWAETSRPDSSWLGDGDTSQNIIDSLNQIFSYKQLAE